MSKIAPPIESFYSNKQDYLRELDRVERHNRKERMNETQYSSSSSSYEAEFNLIKQTFVLIKEITLLCFDITKIVFRLLSKIVKYIYTKVSKKQKN